MGKIAKQFIEITVNRDGLRHFQQGLIALRKCFARRDGRSVHSVHQYGPSPMTAQEVGAMEGRALIPRCSSLLFRKHTTFHEILFTLGRDARTKPGDFFNLLLERLVRPVAVGRGLRALALAQGDFFRLVHRKLKRLEPSSFVRPITERLIPRSSTRTPIVSPRFQRQYRRLLGCNAWLSHNRPPCE